MGEILGKNVTVKGKNTNQTKKTNKTIKKYKRTISHIWELVNALGCLGLYKCLKAHSNVWDHSWQLKAI